MQLVFRTTTRVLPGGQVIVTDPELAEGQTVEVIVLPQRDPTPSLWVEAKAGGVSTAHS